MSLKKQLLAELETQDALAQQAIKELDDEIETNRLLESTVNGGAFAGAARTACQNRIHVAFAKKDKIIADNAWIKELLSKYKKSKRC